MHTGLQIPCCQDKAHLRAEGLGESIPFHLRCHLRGLSSCTGTYDVMGLRAHKPEESGVLKKELLQSWLLPWTSGQEQRCLNSSGEQTPTLGFPSCDFCRLPLRRREHILGQVQGLALITSHPPFPSRGIKVTQAHAGTFSVLVEGRMMNQSPC